MATIYDLEKRIWKGSYQMKIDRLVSIIIILLEKKRIGAQELADIFEVSPRTIYRDIDAINLAGIPVRSTSGVGGGFEIMEEYKLDKKFFSADDLSALLMGLSSLSGIVRGDEVVHALAKVKSMIPAERAKEIELKAGQIYIDLSQWTGSRSMQPYLETIKSALQKNQLLLFEYVAHHGNKTVRTVAPYQLVLKGHNWYLYGFCHTKKEFRLFRISRMSNLKMQEETFTPKTYQKPVLDFSELLETMQIKIKIRIHESILDRVLDYCACEDFSPDGDSHYLVDFPFIENDYHYDMLLGFGNNCECLEPPHVRENMKRKIHALSVMYEK